jgi:hypothetical protein
MIHWKIIIIIIIIKILSLVIGFYTSDKKPTLYIDNENENEHKNEYENKNEYVEMENKKCLSPAIRDFIICWIKFTIEIIDYSKAIIKKEPNEEKYYNSLEKTKNELINLFYKIYKEFGDKFKYLINKEIIYKIALCKAVVYNNSINIIKYSQELKTNTMELINLFIEIQKNKQDQEKLKTTMKSHNETYIKSVQRMKHITNEELTRELVLGSMDTIKLLFI